MKIQTPETLWGVIKLYLTLSLFAIPFGYALDFEWQHVSEGDNVPHVVTLVLAASVTYSIYKQITKDYGGSEIDKDFPVPPMEHPTDQSFWKYMDNFLKSAFTLQPIGPQETIVDYVHTWADHDGWLVPEQATLSRKHRQGAYRRLLIALKTLYQVLAQTAEIVRLKEELLTYKLEVQENVATLYPGPTSAGMERAIVTPMFLREELQRLAKLSDYSQLWELAGNPSTDDKQNIDSGELLAREISKNILAHLSTIWNAIPEQYKVLKSTTPGKAILDSVRNIERALNRTKVDIHRMSGVIPTGPGTLARHLTLTQIWDALPNSVTSQYTTMPDETEMQAALGRLILDTKGKQPMVVTNCTHPEDLSVILVGDATLEWPDSLQQVQDLLDAAQRPAPVPTGGTQTERLFSSNDVPKLTDEDDYWTYRRSFEIFASAVTVTPTDIPVAISRILNRYEGKRRDYMMAYDVGNNIKPTWTPTWRAILHYMDARFLDRDAHLELFKKWITLRPSDKLWGQGFIAEFDRLRMTLNQIAVPQRKTVISNDKSLERLIDKLPTKVRNAFRYNHPNAEYQLMDATDTTTLENIYDWIIDDWKFLRSQGDLGSTKEKDTKKTGGSHSGIPTQNKPGTPRVHPAWGTCNKPCWDEETTVPNGYRGKYMNISRGKDLICPHCRRRKEEHNGHPTGCQHHGEHRFHGPSSNSSDPSGNDHGDQ